MIRSSIEKDFPAAKKEDNIIDRKNLQEPSSSRPWLGLKDPRIVRVSSAFGGKDRHSKVRTIRGLRDRRVRLSVATAIQLYDLQARLGLNQPSKVVDWLLNAAQHAIDELPPLQMPPENYAQYSQPNMAASREVTTAPEAPVTSLLFANAERSSEAHSLTLLSGKGDSKSKNEMDAMLPKSMHWISNDPHSRDKCKGVGIDRSDWMKRNEHENEVPVEVPTTQKWTHDSRPSHSFLTGSLNNVMPYTSYYHLELPPNASVSHLGGHGCSSQTEELHNSSGSQLLLYPSGTTQTVPSYITPPVDFDPRHIMGFQMLGSSSQNLQPNPVTASLYSINSAARTFQLSFNPRQHHSHEIQPNALEKGINGPSTANTSTSFLNDSKATLGSNSFSFM